MNRTRICHRNFLYQIWHTHCAAPHTPLLLSLSLLSCTALALPCCLAGTRTSAASSAATTWLTRATALWDPPPHAACWAARMTSSPSCSWRQPGCAQASASQVSAVRTVFFWHFQLQSLWVLGADVAAAVQEAHFDVLGVCSSRVLCALAVC